MWFPMRTETLGILLLATMPAAFAQPPAMTPEQQAAAAERAKLTAEDHQQMMDQLHIASLRPGKDGSHPDSPNYANYDESKANPYPKLPDPLTLKNGKKVTSAKMWWDQRRPQIVEDFDREVFGRMPKNTPKVNWEVTSTTHEKNGDFAVITKKLVGHVDNSSYPSVKVDIDLTLSTPEDAKGPVPVIMEFGFVFPPDSAPGAAGLRAQAAARLRDRRGSSRCWRRVGVTQSSFPPAFRPITVRVCAKASSGL